jgi:tetratricopeptide repeat protein/doubled CXXCH motif protein/cytochrome c554/c'-like protein
MSGRPLAIRILAIAFSAVLLVAQFSPAGMCAEKASNPETMPAYVGSRVCSGCHRQIYSSYRQTDMGRSMAEPAATLLEKIPSPITVFDPNGKRDFQVSVHDGHLFQAEIGKDSDGKEVFRDSHKIDWIIGSGANGFGAIFRREHYLFEAPLSFYSKTNSWALSPGYEFANYGFSRPILPGCIACHSGQPQAVPGGNGLFREPPFEELAVGCENCHGPGEAHVSEMTISERGSRGSRTIVNPGKLSLWSADNICMSCHQTGDARVLQPGKNHRDFLPGAPLDRTLAILMVPPTRENPLQSDLLEHYFSMTLSKCYRHSAGRLGCVSCHDPHLQPSSADAPTFFRRKCLSCHTEKSCAVPLVLRDKKTPPDDCAGCHMPKRDIKTISHSALTNHRIVRDSGEPFPEVAASTQTPGLIHLSAVPGQKNSVAPVILVEAYEQIVASHPEYRQRYWYLARKLEKSHGENVTVLRALADWATHQKTPQGNEEAIEYLKAAVKNGDTDPTDYEGLATLMMARGAAEDAVLVLQRGLQVMPYDAIFYRLLGKVYRSLKKNAEATQILRRGAEIFPQDPEIRELLRETEPSSATGAAPTTR